MTCKHSFDVTPFQECARCIFDECERRQKMSGCHVPLSEKEMNDNSLYTTIKELEIENKNLHTKIERLKDILSEMIYKL